METVFTGRNPAPLPAPTKPPIEPAPRLTKVAAGIHRLDGQLMVVLDVDRVLEIVPELLAA